MIDKLDAVISAVIVKNFIELIVCHTVWRSLPYNRLGWISQKESPVMYAVVFIIVLSSHGLLIVYYMTKQVSYYWNRPDFDLYALLTPLINNYETHVMLVLFVPVLLCFTYSLFKYLVGIVTIFHLLFKKLLKI